MQLEGVKTNMTIYKANSNVFISSTSTDFSNVSIEGSLLVGNRFQGIISGYTSGGDNNFNVIDKFPFATDTNATDVGDLSVSRYSAAGQSSSTSGYNSGGELPSSLNTIEKFPFAANNNSSYVGELTVLRGGASGQSSSTFGYNSGGSSTLGEYNTIDKFPFASDANATDVGDLLRKRFYTAGQSSQNSGYVSGGFDPSIAGLAISNAIERFPFASNVISTDVSNLAVARLRLTGQSSTVSGYSSGGSTFPSTTSGSTTVDKFPFASSAASSFVGDLTVARYGSAGQSSTVSGYNSGANNIGARIDKFSFTTDGNASVVGDLTTPRRYQAGQQI